MKKYSKPGRLLVIAGLLLGGPSAAQADQQYWVSLGSYSKLPGAEERRNLASETFSNLSVVPSESAIGSVYRVIEGPVSTRDEAESKLEQARMAGFFDAWLLAKEDSFVMPDGVSDADLAAAATDVSDTRLGGDRYTGGYGLQGSASGTVLGGYSRDYADENSADDANDNSYSSYNSADSDDYVNLPLGKQELVEEAPAGYGLHQLRRAGGAEATRAAPESRLRALDATSDKQKDDNHTVKEPD